MARRFDRQLIPLRATTAPRARRGRGRASQGTARDAAGHRGPRACAEHGGLVGAAGGEGTRLRRDHDQASTRGRALERRKMTALATVDSRSRTSRTRDVTARTRCLLGYSGTPSDMGVADDNPRRDRGPDPKRPSATRRGYAWVSRPASAPMLVEVSKPDSTRPVASRAKHV